MFDIANNGIVKLTRGDTFCVPYFINANTELSPTRYVVKDNDNLYFALMEPNQSFENAILKKAYNALSEKTEFNDIIIMLRPEDTEYLLPGKYYYTVKLRFGDGAVITTTPTKEFWIVN